LKKPPSKVAQKYSKKISPIAAQTAQTEEFMFQNVAYRPTVYRTGDATMYRKCKILFVCPRKKIYPQK